MRRGRILILLGLILALGAAAVVFFLLQGASEPDAGQPVEREMVVVAVQPIAEDEPVEGRLDLKEMPKEVIPEGALRTLEGTSGMLAAGPLPQGTIVQFEMLISPEEMMREGTLSQLVEPGFLGVAFPIDELASVSYGVQAGDYVDILVTFPFIEIDEDTQMKEPLCPPLCPGGEGGEATAQLSIQEQRLVTQLTLQDVLVLGVGRWVYRLESPEEGRAESDNEGTTVEPPQFITLMLEPQDALVIKLAREMNAEIDLGVRGRDDHTEFTNIQQVTLDYILARFNITIPPKHDFTIETLPAE
jgi:Flp pilus assembly protein CpaB